MSKTKVEILRAKEKDIPAIAALFTEAFRDSVLHHCGSLPQPQAMEDVFQLVYEAEPAAAIIASSGGRLVGYCFAPVNLSRLWWQAVAGGHIIKWAWRWLTGRYGFGIQPVKVIVLNKMAFLSSSLKPKQAVDARILSIAVAGSHRGQGIAGMLMDTALDYFQQQKAAIVRLEVRPNNIPAIKVYEKRGFVPDGITKDSQGNWLIMTKKMGV